MPAPVTIEVPDPPAELDVGERTPLTLVLTRPADACGQALVRQVRCNEPTVLLDTDLFQRDTPLQPGESYRVAVFLQPTRPGVLRLSAVEVQVDGELHQLPDRSVPIGPSLGQEVTVALEPICTYEQGTKVQLTFTHTGSTTFHDVTLRLEPAEVVRAGMSVLRRGELSPGDAVRLEAVLAAGQVTVSLSALAAGQRVEARRQLTVPTAPARPEGKAFRFLEPRRLSVDQIDVRPLEPADAPPIQPVRGIYPLRGREHYRIVIRPSHVGVTGVRLRELPEQVHVNPSGTKALPGRWEFEVFVPANAFLTRPARLFYDMETPEGTFSGEVHLAIGPPRWKYGGIAIALGAALTLQSAGALLTVLLGGAPDWGKVLARFNPLNGLHAAHFWQLLSIPVAWVGLELIDRLQYRWQA
jgi:hypothetical protein